MVQILSSSLWRETVLATESNPVRSSTSSAVVKLARRGPSRPLEAEALDDVAGDHLSNEVLSGGGRSSFVRHGGEIGHERHYATEGTAKRRNLLEAPDLCRRRALRLPFGSCALLVVRRSGSATLRSCASEVVRRFATPNNYVLANQRLWCRSV